MQDDDKQRSFERLDETNPERNHRSFFDWLRGKEETDEEKLRKKLDEELKEAARKRATDFEEERRVEEQREVTETRKLKKRWRAKLVEKSKRLLGEAVGHGGDPTNGYEIAKLMVAERIVKLHDILATEDLRKSEMKSLKIHIDFMGLLSEKLDRPEIEVPEEVERLYETITTSVEETTGEVLPTPRDEEPETTPISEADAAYNAFAASIVQAIRRTLQSQNTSDTLGGDNGGYAAERTTPLAVHTPNAQRPQTQPETQHTGITEQLLSIVKGAALSAEEIKQELSQTDHARKLADVVERAAMVDRFVTHEVTRGSSSPSAEKNSPLDIVSEKAQGIFPDKKIKFLTDLELIALAERIEVGGGRLLSDVYKKGELDHEGLVKVLESYKKGLDYRSELMLRRDTWRWHKETSPEYLGQPVPAITPPPTSPKTSKQESGIPEYHPTPSTRPHGRVIRSPITIGKFRDIGFNRGTLKALGKNVAEAKLVRNIKDRAKRQSQIALLVISVILVVIVVIAVIELSSL